MYDKIQHDGSSIWDLFIVISTITCWHVGMHCNIQTGLYMHSYINCLLLLVKNRLDQWNHYKKVPYAWTNMVNFVRKLSCRKKELCIIHRENGCPFLKNSNFFLTRKKNFFENNSKSYVDFPSFFSKFSSVHLGSRGSRINLIFSHLWIKFIYHNICVKIHWLFKFTLGTNGFSVINFELYSTLGNIFKYGDIFFHLFCILGFLYILPHIYAIYGQCVCI